MSAMAVPLGVYLSSGSRVRFPIKMTLLKLAMAVFGGSGDLLALRLHLFLGAKLQVVLAVDFFVELELGLQFTEDGRLTLKDEVHIITVVERTGSIAELAAI